MKQHELQPEDAAFAARARAQLDAGVEQLDAVTLARLQAARLRALDTPRRSLHRWWFAAPTALASVAVAGLALLLLSPTQPPSSNPATRTAVNGTDVLPAAAETELYEDLDFYRWLDRISKAPREGQDQRAGGRERWVV